MLPASGSSDQPELELINPPSSPVKGDANPNDGVVVETLGSTKDCDRDSIMGVSEEDANQGDDESNLDSDSWENAATSGPESAAGDSCLMLRH